MAVGVMLVICAAAFGTAISEGIPEYIHVCLRSDPNVEKCVRNSVEIIKPRLREGIKELDVPGLEPLHISEIPIFPASDSSSFGAVLKNIDVYGASDFQITKLKLNIPDVIYHIGVTIPLLRLVGTYSVTGRILVVPLQGEGKFSANATNCVGKAVLRGELTEANGEQRLKFTAFELKLRIGDYNVNFESFNGDPTISQAATLVLNQNRKDFIGSATPFIERTVAGILLDIANNVVKNFSYDSLFPEK